MNATYQPIPTDERRNLHQALIVLESEIDELLQTWGSANRSLEEEDWYQGRLQSCQDAIQILRRYNRRETP